jgi:microcystin degradation protein MlrC
MDQQASSDRRLRVYAGSVQTETNTFSPLLTTDASFEELSILAGKHPAAATLYTHPLTIGRRICKARNWDLVEGSCFGAHPGGPVLASTWHRLKIKILEEVKGALPLDVVVLGLHGAMVSQDCDDCEGNLLDSLRGLVGPDCIIAATLDPHCHLSDLMVRSSDLLIPFKEYPHTDAGERAEDLWKIIQDMIDSGNRPIPAIQFCGLMTMFFTPDEPCAQLIRLQSAIESEPEILTAGLIQGFPWGDVPDFGTKTLVYSRSAKEAAQQAADRLASAVQSLRGQTMPRLISVEEAVSEARKPRERLLVLADFADNVGAGCPGDATYLSAALIEADIRGAACALMWDPVAVSLASAGGLGARLPLRIGGKACALSGKPIDAVVEIIHIERDAVYDFKVLKAPLGDVVTVRTESGFEIVLTSLRCQCFTPSAFTDFGIDLSTKRLLVVKSMQHFTAGFRKIEKDVFYVDSPGVASFDITKLTFKKADQDIWPFKP